VSESAWETKYRECGRVWGDGPSEIGKLAADVLAHGGQPKVGLRVLDVGCGYGRDSVYLADEIGAHVLGIDTSPAAVAMARESAPAGLTITFEHRDFNDLDHTHDGRYDVVLAAQLYHLLRPGDRKALAARATRLLAPGGRLFLSSLATSDRQHFGKGEPVLGEPNSFVDNVYLHLCTGEELRADFAAIEIERLEEHAFDEPQANGVVHHHVLWLLVARRGV
jgi:cyclopropane fatty-acyl-phospholipid synthase-like methyltransferase